MAGGEASAPVSGDRRRFGVPSSKETPVWRSWKRRRLVIARSWVRVPPPARFSCGSPVLAGNPVDAVRDGLRADEGGFHIDLVDRDRFELVVNVAGVLSGGNGLVAPFF